MNAPVIIGLTGGIGSGKSSVGRLLARLGARVIDADQLARKVVEPGTPGHQAVAARFGASALHDDGTLNRAYLARLVFKDPRARKTLEAIIHPRVREELWQRAAALAALPEPPPAVVLEVPLLIEGGLHTDVDQVWVVTACEETCVRRVMERDGISREEVRARMEAQLPLAEKVRLADVVIDNDGPWEETEASVRRAWVQRVARGREESGV